MCQKCDRHVPSIYVDHFQTPRNVIKHPASNFFWQALHGVYRWIWMFSLEFTARIMNLVIQESLQQSWEWYLIESMLSTSNQIVVFTWYSLGIPMLHPIIYIKWRRLLQSVMPPVPPCCQHLSKSNRAVTVAVSHAMLVHLMCCWIAQTYTLEAWEVAMARLFFPSRCHDEYHQCASVQSGTSKSRCNPFVLHIIEKCVRPYYWCRASNICGRAIMRLQPFKAPWTTTFSLEAPAFNYIKVCAWCCLYIYI